MKLEFSASGLTDGDFIRNELAVLLDLDCYSEMSIEKLFCISYLHAALDLETVNSPGIDCLCGLVIELLESKVAVSNLLTFVEHEFHAKSLFEISRKRFQFLLRRHGKLRLGEIVLDFVKESHNGISLLPVPENKRVIDAESVGRIAHFS